jgi:hypothetical protein
VLGPIWRLGSGAPGPSEWRERLVAEVTEVESGKRFDRPRLVEALKLCRIHGATLIIAKLDRLDRNVAFISALMESGVEFEAVDFPHANRLTCRVRMPRLRSTAVTDI